MNVIQKQIVIIGAGPSGAGAALRLSRAGYRDILILDRFDRIGGIAGKYCHLGRPTFVRWSTGRILHGPEYADRLARKLTRAGIETRLETTVLRFLPEEKELQVVSAREGAYRVRADTVLFACGARERTRVERGWIFGQRPARVYHTLHLLELMSHSTEIPPARFHLLGSEEIAYSLAEKLGHVNGAPLLIDHEESPGCSLFSRLYFFRKGQPRRIPAVREIRIQGQQGMEGIVLKNASSESIPADNLILTGNLIPNTELLATASIPFSAETRQILPEALKKLQGQGIFITGNMQGSTSGGERAYLSGFMTAARIMNYLKSNREPGQSVDLDQG
ncbi:NAD(P)-binding protein [bacterium]|nr:NAD(P)-binding protein [bacterium]